MRGERLLLLLGRSSALPPVPGEYFARVLETWNGRIFFLVKNTPAGGSDIRAQAVDAGCAPPLSLACGAELASAGDDVTGR
jgi:hypothetical protein